MCCGAKVSAQTAVAMSSKEAVFCIFSLLVLFFNCLDFFHLSASGSLVAADELSGKLRGGFVSVFLCAISLLPDFLFCLFPRAAEPDDLVDVIFRGLGVSRFWRGGLIFVYYSFRTLFGLNPGLLQSRAELRATGHSGRLIHPVKTREDSDPIFIDGNSSLRSGLYCM